MRLPTIGISMGDPAGIGPEICLKTALHTELNKKATLVVIGEIDLLVRAGAGIRKKLILRDIDTIHEALPGRLNVISLRKIAPAECVPGKQSSATGKASFAYLNKAIDLALAAEIDAIVTGPISKEALHLAGLPFPGHTEILAQRCSTQDYAMMFSLDNVHVAHVTTHCSVRKAIDLISKQRVLSVIRLLDKTIRSLGLAKPAIAVGGLNPHASENGLFGTEEAAHIVPAIAAARAEGINALGPFPPDTMFMRAFSGEFCGVVAMLHDHGFTALKSRNFGDGVNTTIGLPIIRTSVGHGTGFDIAGKGCASEQSMIAAITTALQLVENRKKNLRKATRHS